jgi:flagellar biosynthesis GTPase FlhF
LPMRHLSRAISGLRPTGRRLHICIRALWRMHMTRQYRAAAGRARNAAEKTADFWTQGARTVTDLVPGLPQVDLVPAVERYFELVQRTVDINRHFAVRWAEAVGTLSGVVRDKAESAGDLVREKAEVAGNVVREQAEKAEQAALEQAEKAEQAEKERARQARQAEREQAAKAEQAAREQAEQAEKERARQARQAEREQARRAHERARERYEGLTKAELSDLLAKRELPKTGNVDELIERLVEADSK